MANNPFKAISWDKAYGQLITALADYANDAEIAVSMGNEHVYRINDDAVCLLRAEGFELVVVGFAGCQLNECVALIIIKARCAGFTSIRAHTKRRGMCRFLNEYGVPFHIVERRNCGEFVIRMEL